VILTIILEETRAAKKVGRSCVGEAFPLWETHLTLAWTMVKI
jgi:hypothetical protein